MIKTRQLYFVSNKYRSTLRVGDEVIQNDYGSDPATKVRRGTIANIVNRISIKWSDGEYGDGDLVLSGDRESLNSRTPTFRMEDLTDEERVEIVTLKLQSQ